MSYLFLETASGLHSVHACAGKVEEFMAPKEATYKLEVWGAQGGPATIGGGKGGYANGKYNSKRNTKLYCCIGQSGKNITIGSHAFNGGGFYGYSGGGGGGATHIALAERGVLSNYYNNQSEILLVAGGGGGSDGNIGSGGSGGGENGGNGGTWDNMDSSRGLGGTQSVSGGPITGAFGKGGDTVQANGDYEASGGGGWYGGGGSNYVAGCGGGGSGHINSTFITNGSMENGVQEGNGNAQISWSFQ